MHFRGRQPTGRKVESLDRQLPEFKEKFAVHWLSNFNRLPFGVNVKDEMVL